jgi:hypothetical protein
MLTFKIVGTNEQLVVPTYHQDNLRLILRLRETAVSIRDLRSVIGTVSRHVLIGRSNSADLYSLSVRDLAVKAYHLGKPIRVIRD